MSIDYSNVKAMSDHIGNIVKITDASGNVMWKQAPSGATVVYSNSANSSIGITVDGITYYNTTEIVVPLGTVIYFDAAYSAASDTGGEIPRETSGSRRQYYVVTGDVRIVVATIKPNQYVTIYQYRVAEL